MENKNAHSPEKVLYTAKTHTTGGREGASQSNDDRLNVRLSVPGTSGLGTNPEQLFASGWSACFIGAMGLVASKMNIELPENTAVDAEVDLCLTGGEYYLQARLNVRLPGVDPDLATIITDGAQQTCPYSKAVKGNIKAAVHLV